MLVTTFLLVQVDYNIMNMGEVKVSELMVTPIRELILPLLMILYFVKSQEELDISMNVLEN